MAMGDRRPSRNSPPSRLIGLPPLPSFGSVTSNSGMRSELFVSPTGGLSQTQSLSPTLERRPHDRSLAVQASRGPSDHSHFVMDPRVQASIRIRMLPRNFDVASLRNILIFSKDLKDCYFTGSEDEGHLSAVATFGSLAEANDAQERLNGKALPDNGASMIVDVMQFGDMLGSRRNTMESTGARHQSTSSSSASSNTMNTNNPLIRHSSRYSFSYPSVQDGSPPLRSSEANSTRLQNLFSPTSPVANGISGNSLRHDDIGEDETGQLLNETLPHARNGQYSVARRATNTGNLESSFNGLSISTNGHGNGMVSPSESGIVSPRTYTAATTPSTHNMGGSHGGNWEFNRPRQSMPPANPADQNPPCNTLYVGNLPPNTCEDELKTLFSRQRGYKRLCFRTKHNGPMCFVEFDDINYAAQSLDNLYGTMLTNSVKGGIRLSFSKNPLGVRRDPISGPNSPMSSHSMVSAISNGSGAAFATANGPPPGLPLPGSRGYINTSNSNSNSIFNNNGGGPVNTGVVSPVRSLPSPGAYYNQAMNNGHSAGLSDARQHMFAGYTNPANGTFGRMANGA